jgi:hypothetical protein
MNRGCLARAVNITNIMKKGWIVLVTHNDLYIISDKLEVYRVFKDPSEDKKNSLT